VVCFGGFSRGLSAMRLSLSSLRRFFATWEEEEESSEIVLEKYSGELMQ
jgi:hypothetical protein